ncbi:MAG: Cell division protein FtsX [Firmicutes bacterium]|nr:Cell division protein FtsX [Bacillota bacterium]
MVKPRTFGYFFESAGKSLLRNSWMTLASISTVAVSLLVLGIFLVVAANINAVAANVEGQLQVTAHLATLSAAERGRLEAEIKAIPGVTDVRFVPQSEAWQRLLEWYGDNQDFLAGWEEENPLRDSFEIRADVSHRVPEVAAAVTVLAGVEEVLWGREIVEQLLAITRMMRLVGIGLMVALALAALFIIANTIRMAIFARRREIGIMRYIGATNWFIRWPFVIEGLVLGLLGGMMAASVLAWGYYLAVRALVQAIPFWPWVQPWPFLQQLALLLLSIGVVIGILGSGLSLRRYLDA